MTESLSGLEFTILRAQRGFDRLYLPLRFRPTADSAEQLRQQTEAAIAGLARTPRPQTEQALDIGDDPAAALTCLAVDANHVVTLRIYLAVKHGHAALFHQGAGATPDVGGDLTISVVSQAEAPDVLAGYLPNVQAGRHPAFAVAAPGDGELPEQAAAVLRQRRVNTIEFCVFAGGLPDAELPIQYETFTVADFAGDGRYLVTNSATLAATPLPAGQLQVKIAALLAQHAPEPGGHTEPVGFETKSGDNHDRPEDEAPYNEGRAVIVNGVLTFTTEEEPKSRIDYRPRYAREGRTRS